jgi:AcrR family transcriptional regulator
VTAELETIEDRRAPLTRERVLRAAIDLADRGGIEALSMRKLGQELGVEAMALYRHVRDKNDLLDGVVDLIVGEIEGQPAGEDWKATMRGQAMAARATMLRHPWARRALEDSGTTGPASLVYIESLLATLRDGGFSLDLAHHSLHVLGSRVFGFSQDIFEEREEDASAEPNPIVAGALADRFPRITELAQAASHEGVLGRCDDDVEFGFGLDLILDGLERRRAAAGEAKG